MPSRASDRPDRWVGVDVAATTLGVTEGQARRIAKTEGWRTAPGQRPVQFLFADIIRSHRQRKENPT